MSALISRIEYHSLLNGSSAANFIDTHFQHNESGSYYITKERVLELNKTLTNLDADDKATLQELLEATNEHGDFDVSISW
jgi:hypothetical protein